MKKLLITTAFILTVFNASAQEAMNPDFSTFPHWQMELAHEKVSIPNNQFHGDYKPALDKVFAKWKKLPYKTSTENYGDENYWATREETIAKGSYDCKGFDIAAMYDLIEMDVPQSDMTIEVVYIKSTGELHSVLRVGNWFIDNRAPEVMPIKVLHDYYIPIFDINRLGWKSAQ